MKENIKRIFIALVLLVLVVFIFYKLEQKQKFESNKVENLVIFGDNIDTKYAPFMEGNVAYISVDTISKVIDNHIYYDKVATKVIITTYTDVIKLKIGEKKISRNLEINDIENEAKLVNGVPYIPITLFTDVYGITIMYNDETSTLAIDNKDESDLQIKYNQVNVYEDLSTASQVLQTLYKGSTVKLYDESLEHERWYKVRTETGIVGYIAKNSVDITENEENINDEGLDNSNEQNSEKVIMFWQYGSDIDVLGDKETGVNVVSPTWYEMKNSKGEISSKYSKAYYDKAKLNGYEIWPIVTNGIDNANYSSADTSAMMNSEASRENFIKNLIKIAQEHRLDGINIDFEAMKTDDKELYTQFIRELCPIFRKYGIKVSVDIYFVAYMERGKVAESADYIILMGYDQRGNWSNEAGSISEISWVDSNINSLIKDSNIPANKIILGVPFYTRLWLQNNANSSLTSKIYSMRNCINFIESNDLEKTFDEKSGQNYAEYTRGDITYKLWLEDEDSMVKRIDIIKKYGLAGISAWQRGLETEGIWSVITENINK